MLSWNRTLSLVAYLGGAALIWNTRGADTASLFLLTQALVLIFIWFPDFFGSWLGAPPFGGGNSAKVIDQESPAWLVAGFGWLILLGVFVVTYFWS
jgi:hypothetical protein